ncbi:MAG: NADH-quinone oxidoreductase subunit NuoE [Enterobacteriaceae bacterium]
MLNEYEVNKIEKILKNYENKNSAIIEVMKIVQKNRGGWISNKSMEDISKFLKIDLDYLEEIATFYSQIFRKPVGKYIIKFCDGIVCYINGYKEIKKIIESMIKIKSGDTTKDKKFTLLPISCLGNCDKSPTILINEKLYSNLNKINVSLILKKYI